MERVREDLRNHLGKEKGEDASKTSMYDYLNDEKMNDLDFLPNVMNEALRFEPAT